MTEAVKHTPGPWKVDGPDWYGDYNILPSHESLAIAAVVRNGLRAGDETEANARLIAAAPDLLALSKQLLDVHGLQGETASKLRAAIAQAEGR